MAKHPGVVPLVDNTLMFWIQMNSEFLYQNGPKPTVSVTVSSDQYEEMMFGPQLTMGVSNTPISFSFETEKFFGVDMELLVSFKS